MLNNSSLPHVKISWTQKLDLNDENPPSIVGMLQIPLEEIKYIKEKKIAALGTLVRAAESGVSHELQPSVLNDWFDWTRSLDTPRSRDAIASSYHLANTLMVLRLMDLYQRNERYGKITAVQVLH